MPRSSRHKSHKQSKHSSRDNRDHSESDDDVKKKDRNSKEESSVRVSRDSGSSEKRKNSSSKDPSGNGDVSEEFVASKRRKEKSDVDRWNSGGDERGEAEKSSKTTALVDSKSKSSKRHDSGSEKKEEKAGLVAEKEESSKLSSRVDSKRKSEKESGRKEVQQLKEVKEKEKERGVERERERERKSQETKRDKEVQGAEDEVVKKQGLHSVDLGEERQGKRGRENTDIQVESRNPELEKELEKRMRRRKDGSNDKDKHQDDGKESEDKRLSSRGERLKDGRHKDEKHKDGSYGDKRREDGDRDNRNRDDKYWEDAERDNKHRDVKHQEVGDSNNKLRDDKYHEDGERDNRSKDDKRREDADRDNRHKDDKYREDGDRDNRRRDNKYRADGDRDNRRRGDKYREERDRDDRHRDDKYLEDGDRDDRHKDDWYLEDGNRDGRNREEKNWEDVSRDGRHSDGKQRDDNDKNKRLRDIKYRDEHSSRDRSGDKSDYKRWRDENTSELYYRKSNNRDGSPIFDDRSTRYKDDKGRRRTSDKEDHGDIRSQSIKEQHTDATRKSISGARVESGSDRGRSNTRNTDVEITPNHSRRRSSPSSSSHTTKDHYRNSKQEESKYRDNAHEGRVWHNVTSKEFAGVAGVTEKVPLTRSTEKSLHKDDNCLAELSAERRSKADARSSPLQVVDKSPSSTSTDRRYLNRSDVRRSLDIEYSGQRIGSLKDAKEYSSREGRGNRELPMDTLPADDLSQADGDNLSVSSPFSRNSYLSSNSRSLLPPPPFRMGADSPSALGSLEDDNRGRANNRQRRIPDAHMGRMQGSGWRGIPNWPSPLANGFMPFRHGPPPVGFHPVMPQFPVAPMFSVRPSIELNQSGAPYHVPDGDRFSGHGCPLGWRNLVDDSCPPPIHGWDTNNSVFGDESHVYGRLDWDHNKSLTGGQLWETSGDPWKEQNSAPSTEIPSAPQEDDFSAHNNQNDKKQLSVLTESNDIDQPSSACEKKTLEAPKTIPEEMSNLSRNDDVCLSHVYLSMLDISVDLTQPELYSQYTSLTGIDQNTISDEDDSKFLFVEENMDATVKIPNKSSSASLFSTINDSVFQKAMSLYKKLRGGEVGARNEAEGPFSNGEILESAPTLNLEEAGSNDKKQEEVVPACDQQEPEGAVSALNKVKMEVSPAIIDENIIDPGLTDSLDESEQSIAYLNQVKMELDLVSKQETLNCNVDGKSSHPENVEPSDVLSPGKAVEASDDSKGDHSLTNNERQNLPDNKCGSLLFSDMPPELCEAVMPESIESASVNLSRIHQSPESTH